jgi:uncharacterized protein YjlB
LSTPRELVGSGGTNPEHFCGEGKCLQCRICAHQTDILQGLAEMKEEIKKFVEQLTGIARPGKREVVARARKPNAFIFKDDGETPNNPELPLVVYRSAVYLNPSFDPAAIFEVLFNSNQWTDGWRSTMYGYNHLHTRTHECLGIARGTISARFGGRRGRTVRLKAGDVVIIPAGVGHKHVRQSRDLLIVGAYPANSGKYDEPRAKEVDREVAVRDIGRVRLPPSDPVYGKEGPLFSKWHRKK